MSSKGDIFLSLSRLTCTSCDAELCVRKWILYNSNENLATERWTLLIKQPVWNVRCVVCFCLWEMPKWCRESYLILDNTYAYGFRISIFNWLIFVLLLLLFFFIIFILVWGVWFDWKFYIKVIIGMSKIRILRFSRFFDLINLKIWNWIFGLSLGG